MQKLGNRWGQFHENVNLTTNKRTDLNMCLKYPCEISLQISKAFVLFLTA